MRARIVSALEELRQEWQRSIIVGVAVLIVAWLVFYPLGIIFEMGLRAEDGSFTLAHYQRVLTEPGLVSALINSIIISVATTGVRACACAADGLGGGAHQHAGPADRAGVGAGRLRDPELHLGDRLDPAARAQCRPDQRVRARDLRHRPAVQHLQHGRPGAGADLELLPADLLRGHRGARQHGSVVRGGGADGRRAGVARVDGHRAAAGRAGDRCVVGIRVPRSHGRVRRARCHRPRRAFPYADHQDLRAVLLSAALRARRRGGGADHRLYDHGADPAALGARRPPFQRDRRQVERRTRRRYRLAAVARVGLLRARHLRQRDPAAHYSCCARRCCRAGVFPSPGRTSR